MEQGRCNGQGVDITAALTHLRAADPVLAAIIDAVGAYTLRYEQRGFVALVGAIISQQISVKAAAAIKERIVQAVGDFTPERVLALGLADLRTLGLSYQKASYVLDLAAQVHEGRLDLDLLEDLDDEVIINRLTAVKGIGRWTAEMYLMRCLGRPDVLPVDDLGLRQGIMRYYGLEKIPTCSTMLSIAEPWRPYRSIATWYIWRRLIPA